MGQPSNPFSSRKLVRLMTVCQPFVIFFLSNPLFFFSYNVSLIILKRLGSVNRYNHANSSCNNLYAKEKREDEGISFFFFIPQVFDANEIAFLLRSSPSPYFESKAGGYSTCTRWGTYAPVKTKQKSKRARKCTRRWLERKWEL